jgi:polyisoprenoid-binding protein YceI
MNPLLILLAFIVPVASAQDWAVDPVKSRIGFGIRQMNVMTEGGFRRFAAKASFDPARPEAGRYQIEVDINSIDTGAAEGDSEVQRPIWFDSARYPRATFASRSVRKEANGSYTALGELSIKGQKRALAAPFILVRQPGGGFLAQGRFTLKRSDYGIGGGDWNDVVADEADIHFQIFMLPERKPE